MSAKQEQQQQWQQDNASPRAELESKEETATGSADASAELKSTGKAASATGAFAPGATGMLSAPGEASNPVNMAAPLPRRFQDPNVYEYPTKPVHPRYRTTAQAHGARPPVKEELPTQYHVRKHKFTDQFQGGTYRNLSLDTSLSRTRVVPQKMRDIGH